MRQETSARLHCVLAICDQGPGSCAVGAARVLEGPVRHGPLERLRKAIVLFRSKLLMAKRLFQKSRQCSLPQKVFGPGQGAGFVMRLTRRLRHWALAALLTTAWAQSQEVVPPRPSSQALPEYRGTASKGGPSQRVYAAAFGEHEVSYVAMDGMAVHDGDIVLGRIEDILSYRSSPGSSRGEATGLVRRDLAVPGTQRLWPGGIVPYVIDPDLYNEYYGDLDESIDEAIERWNSNTVISLVPRTTQQDYVRFEPTSEGPCRSQLGRNGARQFIWVRTGCDSGDISHQIGHAVGLAHEHQRTDRDDYVMLSAELSDSVFQAEWLASTRQGNGPYDYSSLMHFRSESIETIPPGMFIFGGVLSAGDADGIARLYGRPSTTTVITTHPSWLEVVVDGVRVKSPARFAWAEGSVHTIEAPAWQTTTPYQGWERYLFARWSDDASRQLSFTASSETTWLQANYVLQNRRFGPGEPLEDGFYTLREDRLGSTVFLDDFEGFGATPRSLLIVLPADADAVKDMFRLTNEEAVRSQYVIGSNQPWLAAEPAEVSLPPGASAEIEVTAVREGVQPDTHWGELKISTAGSSWTDPAVIRVTSVILPKPVSVPLGTSGESFDVVVSATEGLLHTDGRPLGADGRVTAVNGSTYSLAKGASGIVATFVPEMQSVQLPSGDSVPVGSLEDGGWQIGGHPVRNGHVIVRGGKPYVLELYFGSWRLARYIIRSEAGSTAVTDGIPAVNASINDPYGVDVDSLGNVYIADTGNERIRKVDLSGFITTIAGTGDWGYSGDGGPATEAQLSLPLGAGADFSGNVYIADNRNARVRKVAPSGIITTLAGIGARGRSGDGGPAIAAQLVHPTDVAADAAGNVYIPDGSRVRKVDSSGIITSVAGTIESGFSGDGGPATEAQLSRATDVAVDAAGNLFIADVHNYRVRKVDSSGVITTLAGTGERGFSGDGGPATEARLSRPISLDVDSNANVLVADGARVRRIDPSGIITTLAGPGEPGVLGDGGPATEARLSLISGVAAGATGNVYVASLFDRRIRKIDPSGTITTLVGTGFWKDAEAPGPSPAASHVFRDPRGAAFDTSGNLFFIDDYRIWKLTPPGLVSLVAGTGARGEAGDGGPATEAEFRFPNQVAVDASGNIYISDSPSHRVRKIDPSGTITTLAGTGEAGISDDGGPAAEARLWLPNSVGVDPLGNVYATEHNRVRKISPSGIITTLAGADGPGYTEDGQPATTVSLMFPNPMAVDGSGNVYVVDAGRVRKIEPSGIITTLISFGNFISAMGADEPGNLYIAVANWIVRIDAASGKAETIAGTGRTGFGGDGGPAIGAALSAYGIAVAPDGSIWFTDGGSRRIRVLRETSYGN